MVVVIIGSAIQFALRLKSYTISPKDFRQTVSRATGPSASSNIQRLITDLRRAYGAHIITDPQWLPISAGGMRLRVQFLHASITEYLAIFHAPFKINGGSGIHWANTTCTVLSGTVYRSMDTANMVNKETFAPAANFRHGQFESAHYELIEDTYIACYGRGFMPVSAVWLNAGSITNADPIAIGKLFYIYGQAVVREMSIWMQEMFTYYKDKAQGKSEL